MRLFIFVDGDEVAAFEASCIPRAGDDVWFKTLDAEQAVIVDSVEHQFDRSRADVFDSHDVCLYCRKKLKSK